MSGYDHTIVVADDHPLFRGALAHAIRSILPDANIIEVPSFDDAQKTMETLDAPDLLLLDIHMPGMQGYSGLLYMRAKYAEVPVVIVSAIEEEAIMRAAIDYGASAYVPKSTPIDAIGAALRSVLDGEIWLPDGVGEGDPESPSAQLARKLATLTPQQVRVLMMLSEGKLNKQIAYELGISEATVKAHVSAILQKLNVNSRTQAVIIASQIGVEDQALLQARAAAIPRQQE